MIVNDKSGQTWQNVVEDNFNPVHSEFYFIEVTYAIIGNGFT